MSWFRKAREDNYSKVNDLIRQASSEAGQAEQQSGSDLYNIRALNLTGLDRGDQGQGRIRPHSRSIFKGFRFS